MVDGGIAGVSGSPPKAFHSYRADRPRSSATVVREASALHACSELQLPRILGAERVSTHSFVSSLLGITIEASSVGEIATGNGLYIRCRDQVTREKLIVAIKGRRFLAPSSAEMQALVEEAMYLTVLRNTRGEEPSSKELIQRFPIAQHAAFIRGADRVMVITLVKDHLENCFQRSSPTQFHYVVSMNDLATRQLQLNFFSLRHFGAAVASGAVDETSAAAHWLFLFAFQDRLFTTSIDGDVTLQRLYSSALRNEAVCAAWERAAELSRGPTAEEAMKSLPFA